MCIHLGCKNYLLNRYINMFININIFISNFLNNIFKLLNNNILKLMTAASILIPPKFILLVG